MGVPPDGRGGCQAPHISVSVFARGLLPRREWLDGPLAAASFALAAWGMIH